MPTELDLGSLSQFDSNRPHTIRRRKLLALIAGAALLQACASSGTGLGRASASASGQSAGQERTIDATTPGSESSSAMSSPRLPWALALGGGAARGLAHIGIIQVLEREGLVPDMVVGTSAGALVGALWASGMDAATLRSVALSFDHSTLGDWAFSTRALLKGQALADFVNRHVGNRPIERFPRRFAATAVDLWSGKLVVFDRGNAGIAVRASAAVPGVFQPVQVAGREYVDGGLASPVPVRIARGMGEKRVLAVDISAKPQFQPTQSLGELLMQTINIMGEHLGQAELSEADLVLRPEVFQRSAIDFSTRPEAIYEGEKVMLASLSKWKQMLGATKQSQ